MAMRVMRGNIPAGSESVLKGLVALPGRLRAPCPAPCPRAARRSAPAPRPSALAAKSGYRAEIRRTTGGVPHIKARDFGSLGFGFGYAYAQDQLCEFASIIVTVNAQRSRYFGADAESPNGGTNLQSDFFWQRIKDVGTVERLVKRRAPHGPSKRGARRPSRASPPATTPTCARPGARSCPDPTCRGKAWVRPITPIDVYRRFYQLGLRASSGNFLREIVAAAPPAAAAAPPPRSPSADAAARAARRRPGARRASTTLGSNAYGVGSEGTRGGRSRRCSATRTSRGRAPSAGTSCT